MINSRTGAVTIEHQFFTKKKKKTQSIIMEPSDSFHKTDCNEKYAPLKLKRR